MGLSQVCLVFITECSGEADIVFVIDKSGSIRSERFLAVKEFFVTVIEDLEIGEDGVRIGLVSFEDEARVDFYLDSYTSKEDVIQAVRVLNYNGGRTNIADALELAREDVLDANRGDRQDVPNFLILFTDGKANINPDDTIPQAIDTRIAGTHIISIGVGNDIDHFELRGIASDPVEYNVFTVKFFNELPDLQLPLIGATCDGESRTLPLSPVLQCKRDMGVHCHLHLCQITTSVAAIHVRTEGLVLMA